MARRFRQTLMTGLAALALACGGRSSRPTFESPSPSSTVAVSGVVAGASGALFFNRQPLHTGSALVTAQGRPSTPSKIQPGTVIQGTATKTSEGYQLQSADVHHELEGVIDGVDLVGSRLIILGQAVKVDALTVMEEEGPGEAYASLTLAQLKAGDRVEVYGSLALEGPVLATRIEREPASARDEASCHGLVSALDSAAKTFLAGGRTVSYSAAMVTGALVNGARVELHGTASGRNLAATWVKVEMSREGLAPSEWEVCGTISGLDPAAKTFMLMSHKMDYSLAKVEGTLVNGARVGVAGRLGADEVPVLRVREIEISGA